MSNFNPEQQVFFEQLGQAIRKRRLKTNTSQEELAAKSSIHRTYLSDVERASRNLTIVTLWKISRALDSEVSQLLAAAEKPQEHTKRTVKK